MYLIEFQKRGLPHAHILLWLEVNSKCKTPAQIDDIISTELPSPTDVPDGYKVVTDYMLHGPYGKDKKYAPCTTEGKCSKHYPKQFYAETVLDEDGYPICLRQENKVSFKKGKFTFDNRHVVPYNHYMLLKYQAHINVEWCNRSKAIKYLFMYYNKGPDRATVVIQENIQKGDHMISEKFVAVDEINNYLNCIYLAPSMRVNKYYPNGEIDNQKQKFNQWVLSVGNGTIAAKDKDGEVEPSWIQIPEQFIINSSDSPIEAIVAETYPIFIERQHDEEYLKERAILTPKNDEVFALTKDDANISPKPNMSACEQSYHKLHHRKL
nr:helicase [Tanacetum cinerariifolium]